MKILILSHSLIAGLYLTFFLLLTTLLFAKKTELFDSIREKVKILRMIVEAALLGTGIALLLQSGYSGQIWLWTKIGLVAVAIGVGIVGMKNKSIFFMVLATMILVYVYGVAETKSLTMKPKAVQAQEIFNQEMSKRDSQPTMMEGRPASSEPIDPAFIEGKSLYLVHCIQCHGADGSLGAGGAKKLEETLLTDAEISTLITNGSKGKMPDLPFLKAKQKEKIILYVRSFKEE